MHCLRISLGIFGAALANFLIGGLWYSPLLFGDLWMRLSGVTPDPEKVPMAMVGSFLCAVLMALIMTCFMYRLRITTCVSAFHFAWMSWAGFILPVALQGVIFENWPLPLFAMNNGYNVVSMIAMAWILAYTLRGVEYKRS